MQFLILSAGTYAQTAVQPAEEKWIAGRTKRKISLQKLFNYSCLVSNQVPVVNCMYLPHVEILHVCSLLIDLEMAYWWKMQRKKGKGRRGFSFNSSRLGIMGSENLHY